MLEGGMAVETKQRGRQTGSLRAPEQVRDQGRPGETWKGKEREAEKGY